MKLFHYISEHRIKETNRQNKKTPHLKGINLKLNRGTNVFQKQLDLIFRPRNGIIRDVLESRGSAELFKNEATVRKSLSQSSRCC